MSAEAKEKPPSSVIRGLRQKQGVRVAAEQSVTALVETAKRSLWSLRQFRLGLRQGRQKLIEEWGPGARGAWYRAVRTVMGHKVTEITDLRQVAIRDWRGPR